MTANRAQTRRFIVVAPVGRDGELLCGVMVQSGYPAECLDTIADAGKMDSNEMLGLLLTDEALAAGGVEALRFLIESQPDWSDLPILLLTSGPQEPHYSALATQLRMEIRSLILLDRPVRKELLLSAVQVACTSRMKQLEVRDAEERQFRSDEALRNTEKLAVAGRLAATMAHEVNNPLEALNNLLFLVEHSSSLEEAKNFAHLAVDELGRITEIVQHTLRFHRAPATPGFTDITELVSSALALFQGKLRERHIQESLAAQRCFAYCSAGEIRQAIVNLIGNAVDAMTDGGTLRLRVSTVNLDGRSYARVTVADTGSGIRKEIRSNLFTQFFTTKGSRGTGLGLWLTRDIVRRNAGRLRFRSRTAAPSGTVFTLYLPSGAPAEQARPGEQPQTEAVRIADGPQEMEAA